MLIIFILYIYCRLIWRYLASRSHFEPTWSLLNFCKCVWSIVTASATLFITILVSYWKCRVERLLFKRVYARFRYFYCVLLNVRCKALKFQQANTRRSHILHVYVVPDVTIGTSKYDFRPDKAEPLLFIYFFLWVGIPIPVTNHPYWQNTRGDFYLFCFRVVALFACWLTSHSDITLVFFFHSCRFWAFAKTLSQ
jgi:hypothetical protein